METLDFTKLKHPDSFAQTRELLKSMELGERLQVKAVEPLSLNGIPAFCMLDGHQLLSAEQSQDSILFEIEKGED